MSWRDTARRFVTWEPAPIPLRERAVSHPLAAAVRAPEDWEGKAAPARDGGINIVPIGQRGRPQYPDTDVATLQVAYTRNPLVYAAINVRSEAVQQAPVLVEKRISGDKWAPLPEHPLRMLLSWPNAQDDEATFTARCSRALDIGGGFYARIYRASDGDGGAPTELVPLDGALVAPVPGPDGQPVEYEYRPGGVRERIPARDVLARWLPHPARSWTALSPLAVALGAVAADDGATEYVRNFYDNAGIISGILKVAGRVDKVGADEIRGRWLEQFARRFGGRQHSVSVQDDKVTYVPIGSQLKDLDNAFLRSLDETRVHMVYGVPPLITYAYIGLLRATYNNLPAAYRGFWETTMTSWYTAHARWLTRRLLPEYEPERTIRLGLIRCRYDLSGVAALQDSADGTQNRARENFKEGAITLNEFRQVVGQKADPAGEYYLRQSRYVATRMGTDVADIPAGAGTTGTGDLSGQVADRVVAALSNGGTAAAPTPPTPAQGGKNGATPPAGGTA